MIFWDNSTAANATINNHGAEVPEARSLPTGGLLLNSTCRTARITNQGTASTDPRGV